MASQSSDSELYSLRWNSYFDSLCGVFMEHQTKETLVDVTLSCEGQFIKAHRLMLSACSIYFKKVFETHSSPQLLIVLNDVKYKDLKLIIQFMYTGEVNVSQAEMQPFLDLGKLLEVKGLCAVGEDKIQLNGTNQKSQNTPSQISVSHDNIVSKPTDDTANKPSNGTANKPTEDTINNPTNDTPNKLTDNAPNKPKEKETEIRDQESPGNVKKRKLPPPFVDVEKMKEKIAKACGSGNHQETLQVRKVTNAFMIFANQWRKKLEVEYPTESNKLISIRLGSMWKSLSQETRDAFYEDARKAADEEDRPKYPGPKKIKSRNATGPVNAEPIEIKHENVDSH